MINQMINLYSFIEFILNLNIVFIKYDVSYIKFNEF